MAPTGQALEARKISKAEHAPMAHREHAEIAQRLPSASLVPPRASQRPYKERTGIGIG